MAKQTDNKTNSPRVGSVFELLGKSANIVKANWQMFAVVNILAILSAIGNAAGANREIESSWTYNGSQITGFSGTELTGMLGVGLGLILLFVLVGIFLFTMATCLEVKSSAGKKPGLSELFADGKKYFFRIIGVVLLAGLIVFGGFILFIVPGVIALGRLIMSPYHLVDKDISVTEALKQSNKQAKGRMGLIFPAIGVAILVSIAASVVGAIPILGPLAGAAISIAYSLVLALRYQQLKGKTV